MYLLKLISTVGSKMHSVHKQNCVSLTAFWKPNQQKNQKSALVHIYVDLKHNICFSGQLERTKIVPITFSGGLFPQRETRRHIQRRKV